MGQTTPRVTVFPDLAEGTAWRMTDAAAPLPNQTADAIAYLYARSIVFNDLAAARASYASAYLSTASVATDMLAITKALGKEKLQYWGFS